jgi:hypothetical protein
MGPTMTATVFLALLAWHLLGDWVAQTDWQATAKTRSWAALAAHLTSYHLLMGTLLLLPVLRDGWPASNALLALTGVDPVWWTPKMRALPSRWESDATTTPVLPAGVQGRGRRVDSQHG